MEERQQRKQDAPCYQYELSAALCRGNLALGVCGSYHLVCKTKWPTLAAAILACLGVEKQRIRYPDTLFYEAWS